MRIDAGSSYLAGIQRTPPAAAAQKSHLVTVPAKAAQSTGPDFTNMTRKELADWVNEKLRNGEMTLDESTPFVGMTINIPVDGSAPPGLDDRERVDFVQKARDGIAGALSRNDQSTLRMLESAMRVMHGGVDRLA